MHNTQQLKDGHELKGLCAVCCVLGAKGVQGGVYRAAYTGRRIQGVQGWLGATTSSLLSLTF